MVVVSTFSRIFDFCQASLSYYSVFWDLYCAAPERREQFGHSEEAKAFHDYGFISSNFPPNGMPNNNPNSNPNSLQMNTNETMPNSTVPYFSPPNGQPNMIPAPFIRYPNPPPRSLVRLPNQPDYNGQNALLPSNLEPGRNVRLGSPGTRSFRSGQNMPSAMSPSMQMGQNQGVSARWNITNSPNPCPPMTSPQDSNGGEIPPYPMRPGGMGPVLYHEHMPHMQSIPPELVHGPINGEYDHMKHSHSPMSVSQQPTMSNTGPPSHLPPDIANFPPYNQESDHSSGDNEAIQKIKESMQEEVKKFDKVLQPPPTNSDDYHYPGMG
ncbi:unnamed protein product [Didymodactylos carnosus]|uniref:Uncharacterized protein n=1 Tax=Didymodactylos carnosus TaxID=1234261 RepID=A0A813XUT2_9BILA|nr:unnamed protein product [Didymodactylos carnosus]CAF0870224.1 unnamed protein product [Didymodactylos carnosus]CAF3582572.1 unnamed protein product [Didymodactylos carnosus]CAF3657564.1 unnamed protein product [Didymodactylos carnosus]